MVFVPATWNISYFSTGRNIVSLAQIKSIKVSDKHDLLDVSSEAGTYSRNLENGVVLTFTVEGGKIVKHDAKDRDGKELKTFNLQMHSFDEGRVCFVCMSLGEPPSDYGDDQICFKAPCHLM
jgi:hypothetical protein